jgi:hypothetical protein
MQPTMHLVWRYILRWRSPTSTILAWACTFLSWYILCSHLLSIFFWTKQDNRKPGAKRTSRTRRARVSHGSHFVTTVPNEQIGMRMFSTVSLKLDEDRISCSPINNNLLYSIDKRLVSNFPLFFWWASILDVSHVPRRALPCLITQLRTSVRQGRKNRCRKTSQGYIYAFPPRHNGLRCARFFHPKTIETCPIIQNGALVSLNLGRTLWYTMEMDGNVERMGLSFV